MSTRLRGTVLAIGGVFATSTIVATIATLVAIGWVSGQPIIDFGDTADVIGTLAFGGLSLIVLAISFRAVTRTNRSDSAGKGDRALAIIIPILAIAGFGMGGWIGYSVQQSHESSGQQIAEMGCEMGIKAINQDELKACLAVYEECEALVNDSPCHEPDSAGQSAACSAQVKTAVANLRRDNKLARLDRDSSDDSGLLAACLVDQVISAD